MNGDPAAGPRWLDWLARRAVRGEFASSPAATLTRADGARGITRRTVLQTATAAVILSGPLRFLIPASARADQASLNACVKASHRSTYAEFQACVKDPGQAFDLYQQAITTATDALLHARNPRKRKRLLAIIDSSTRGLARVVRQIENCNFKWHADRAGGELDCQLAELPPANGGTGGGGVGAVPAGCPGETHGCVGSSICCFGSDACCNCAGGVTCCIYSDCRCCP